jgi:glycosyltransferase involved in cell wall biosynthesis
MWDNMDDLERNGRASIIIPCYNAERFIARTLQSALAQDYNLFDIIIVNDGSTDDTAKIVSEFCAEDQRVRLISTENSGVAAARNTGIHASTAEFVAFLDADDLWVSSKLRLQIEALQSKGEYAAAYCWSVSIDEDDLVLYPRNMSISRDEGSGQSGWSSYFHRFYQSPSSHHRRRPRMTPIDWLPMRSSRTAARLIRSVV